VTDAAGKQWRFDRDAQGNLKGLTTPSNAHTSYGRDALGRVASITNPLGQMTKLVYGDTGLLKRIEQPDDSRRSSSTTRPAGSSRRSTHSTEIRGVLTTDEDG
jgi:YD repeat-containing protein